MPKIGDKYIIEIASVFCNSDNQRLYRVRGFNALVFDEQGLAMLKKYEPVNRHEKHGDCAKCANTYGTLGCCSTVSNIPVFNCEEGMREFKCREAFYKGIDYAWDVARHGLSIGDEVSYNDGIRGVIVKVEKTDGEFIYHVMWSDGSTGDYYIFDEIKPTGRNFPVKELLGKMEGD